jgi:RNA polymerase sigma-70 factor (ECF subfamily)
VFDDRSATELTSLLRRCAEGDRMALRRIYDQHASRLYALALRITGQPALAADALHDAFVQVWENADRFDPDRGAAPAWLVSVVRYRALDIVRRRGREMTSAELPETIDEDPTPLDRMVGNAEVEALRRCLDALEAERRRLISLAFLDGLSHAELAERLAIPLGTIKSSIRRGLAALKRCLEPAG